MQTLIINTVNQLNDNKIILYPTDTVWGIGCDATNEKAVNKIYQLKKRKESKTLIVLVNSFEMLLNYVEIIPIEVQNFLASNKELVTVIYSNPKNLAKNLIAKDNTIAIRIVDKGFVCDLISAFGKPIVSTSANISGNRTPLNFNEISHDIIKGVDFVVSYKQVEKATKSSKIIRFVNNKIEIIRN